MDGLFILLFRALRRRLFLSSLFARTASFFTISRDLLLGALVPCPLPHAEHPFLPASGWTLLLPACLPPHHCLPACHYPHLPACLCLPAYLPFSALLLPAYILPTLWQW